jgi:molybdopterin synthase sulfur carrier subunit
LGTVRVRVLYFAQAREFAGTREDEFELTPPASVRHLFSKVMKAHPRLGGIRDILRTMVNGRLVQEEIELKDGDRIAFIPPVAGG